MPIEDLAYWLGKFVLEVRKQNGREYPPKTLYGLICCFKRYFEQNGVHDVNPLDRGDARFGNFRTTLDAEMQRLYGIGVGVTTNQAEPISPDEEAILWAKGLLGTHNAKVLTNTVYFYNCKIFALRSYNEHHDLRREQFVKKVYEKGHVYLEYVDYGNKTNRGELKHMKVQPKIVCQYEDTRDPDHCVVNIFVKHLLYLPQGVDHFYCRPLPDNGSGIPRYGKQPVGRNMLAKIIPEMCKQAGIEGQETGHSGKVTCATTLYHQYFSDQLIKEHTGHRSLEALHKYKRTGAEQQYEVSKALLPKIATKEKTPVLDDSVDIPLKKPMLSGKENKPSQLPLSFDDDDDFIPLKKKPKLQNPEEVKSICLSI